MTLTTASRQCFGLRDVPMTSRVCQFVIDVDDLDQGIAFWSEALRAAEEQLAEQSRGVYRRLRLPDSNIRVLLQRTGDPKIDKERMHLDIEAEDVETEVQRLESLGAQRWDHQQERGHHFWVLRDPWGNELCVLEPEFPELLGKVDGMTLTTASPQRPS